MKKRFFLVVLIVIILSGCSSSSTLSKTNETPKPTSTATITRNPTITNIPKPTSTNTPYPTSTPTQPSRPSFPAPVIPKVSDQITVENANRLTRLTSLGEGDLISSQVSPDGKWLVLNSSNGILVLDSTSLKKVLFLPTTMKQYEIAFMENGNRISARDCDQGYIWSLPEGKEISHIKFSLNYPGEPNLGGCKANNYSDWENAIVRFPDDQKLHFYSISTGKSVYIIDYEPYRIAVSPDKKFLVLSTADKLVFIQYQDGKVLKEFTEKGIKWLFFYPDGKTLGAVFEKQTKFWSMDDFLLVDTVNGTGLGTNRVHFYPVFSPDGTVLVFRKGDTFRFLRAGDRLLINALPGYGIKFASDSNGVLLDTGTGQVKYYVFNEDRKELVKKVSFSGIGVGDEFHIHSTNSGVFSSDNSKLLLGKALNGDYHYLDSIIIYDLKSGEKSIIDIEDYSSNYLVDAIWLPNKQTYGVLFETHFVHEFDIIDLNSNTLVNILNRPKYSFSSAISFSPQSDLLVFAQGSRVISWDLKNNGYWQLPYEIGEKRIGYRHYSSFNFSPENNLILYDDTSGNRYVFSTNDYSLLKDWAIEGTNWVSTRYILISPDGNYSGNIQVGNNSSSVEITDAWSGNKILSVGGWDATFSYSPGSKMVAISLFTTQGTKVSVYELSTGKQLFSTGDYFSEGFQAPEIAFSPDGKYLAILPLEGYPQISGDSVK